LGPLWKISNFVDKSHYITSNENIVHPLMTNGWEEMPNVFGFAGNTVIKLGYYGSNLFRLMSISPLQDNLEIPVYLSRSMRYGNTSNFFVAMNTEIINRPYLVSFFFFFNLNHYIFLFFILNFILCVFVAEYILSFCGLCSPPQN
jgi:hypothetical protein